jgi:translocation and assembly module TamA
VPRDRALRLSPFARRGSSEAYGGEDGAVVRLRGQLSAAGYLWAAVSVDTARRDTGTFVVFRVDLGPPAKIGGWDISGGESLNGGRVAALLPKPGVRFSEALLNRTIPALARACEDDGFPLASVAVEGLRPDGGRVWPLVTIDTGPRVRVGFLEFSGKPGTKPALLLRAAAFAPRGWSRAATGQWVRNLDQNGLVRVDSQVIVKRDTQYGLRLFVTGLRRNRAGAVAGYDVSAKRVTGSARFKFDNLFDTGRRLEAEWQSAWSRTCYLLGYTEPWVLGTGIDLTGSARQETVDSTFAQTALGLSAAARVASGVHVELGTGFDRLTNAAARTAAGQLWAGTGLRVNTLDVAENPRRGVSLGVETRVGTRKQDSASATVTRVALDVGQVVPIGSTLAWSTALGARAVYSAADLADPELYHLGGPASVRGYRESEFAARKAGWVKLELRYLLDRSSRAFPFFDVGVYEGAAGWNVVQAYGAGARVGTRVGVLGVDYGVAFRDSPLRGKVHLSLETEF